MSSLDKWSDTEAQEIITKYLSNNVSEDLAIRTYSARLLGSDPELVLHGGGNTSVKSKSNDLYGNDIPVLFIKGSGWDLETIEPPGHPAVNLQGLMELRKLKKLSDEEMVAAQRRNLLNPNAPNPSVEALLHAFIPHKFIDHTHSAAILAIANQPNSISLCEKIFGDRVAIIPYIMPGFDLALSAANGYEIAEKKANLNGKSIEGMILINHGIFTFGETAKESYKRMISLVNEADKYLSRSVTLQLKVKEKLNSSQKRNCLLLPYLRGVLGRKALDFGETNNWVLETRATKSILELLSKNNLKELISRGVATPDHVIRMKSCPLLLDSFQQSSEMTFEEDISKWITSTNQKVDKYIDNYQNYFDENNKRVGYTKKQLDPLPRLILLPGLGLIGVGKSKGSSKITADIGEAWIETLLSAESIGKFEPVNSFDTFDLEYWSLEQAKLGKKKQSRLSGQVVVITGAGGTIGSQIAKDFSDLGAEIIAIDIDKNSAQNTIKECNSNAIAIQCDVTSSEELENAFNEIIYNFGGLDILISNAGSAWQGEISSMQDSMLRKSMELNFFSHHYAAQNSVEIFRAQDFQVSSDDKLMGGQLLFNISKQALNPGKGFGAYGIAKSALLALMKQYAIEEGSRKIRSNGVNADRIRSGLLNQDMIVERSKSRGITQEEYMSGNLLRTEVTAKDVSEAFLSLALMKKTTGGLITVDGGNASAMVR